ncbi:kinase-like protein [Fomitiporia mediterranea MF3/22]|uniref:kinase-like protein n=1 Tax=Fomitiporia mediterranea (strain MF3/22) TaxID=694068 RepID=UPI0004407FDD|nr:kinase-like protein [Fomitiporia mediterranea MF3/22]EJC99306.1 kinase-like protein [Fomitiporia mediterranea MF3/22]
MQNVAIKKVVVKKGVYPLEDKVNRIEKLNVYFDKSHRRDMCTVVLERARENLNDVLENVVNACRRAKSREEARNILNSRLPEHRVARYVCYLLTGLQAMHDSENLVHRDIQFEKSDFVSLQNILVFDTNTVKIGDFGKTKYHIHGCFDAKELDIWSFGLVIYMLLTISHPFESNKREETIRNIVQCEPDLPYIKKVRGGVSNYAEQLVKRTLCKNPKDRLTASQALYLAKKWEEHA